MRTIIAALIGLLFYSSSINSQPLAIKHNLNWEKEISKHNLVWEDLPLQWNEGAFTGNGQLGMMVYISEKDSAVVFSIGRSDVTDHRKDPNRKTSIGTPGATVVFDYCRLPIGKLLLKPGAKILSGTITQDIWNAELRGKLLTEAGNISFRAFTPRDADVQLIEVTQDGNFTNKHQWKFAPGRAWSPRALTRPDDIQSKTYVGNDLPELSEKDGYNICKQTLTAGGDYATVYKEVKTAANSSLLYIATANEVPKAGLSVPLAIKTISETEKRTLPAVLKAHCNWWHNFYTKSYIGLPNAQVEDFYWIQLYKMATASRAGGPAVDLFGPYYKTSQWPGMWWNLNIQLTYFPVYTSNHLELGENMMDIVDENFPFLLKTFGGEKLGDMCWTMHNYWRQLAYANDQKGLQQRWLPKAIAIYQEYKKMMIAENGKIGLNPMRSPEYKGTASFPNTNYNLANLRWLLSTLTSVSETAKVNSSAVAEWKKTLSQLMDYPNDENGLMISSNQSVAISHRHYSHLLGLYPLFVMQPDNLKDSMLIDKTVEHWLNIEGGKALAGYSFTGASSLNSALGRGDDALKQLLKLLNGPSNLGQFYRNTFYAESGGKNEVIETPLSGAASVNEMLLQSWGGKIRVFPALPSTWKNASFHNLLAEGAYEVSAVTQNGQVQWIAVKSTSGKPFNLKNSQLANCKVIEATGKYSSKSISATETAITLAAGETIFLKRNKNTETTIVPSNNPMSAHQSFGVKKGQQLKRNQDFQVFDFYEAK
ncbi:hypothetical protein OQZ33_21890 [Pedobacter sp. MC2016-05]|uniref:glycosyl hydrolase family 95 catalytic domain-containing protein n=1 Tax=Pedobacter sp. MC2016-05 TaxID=2994474 RepID=UPI0022466121|nr:hypothetical protein [Pedobacter sp. MC2016-05]MCX2477001.1 hypothetical protein [Pedobacter sp. MC2016-05]